MNSLPKILLPAALLLLAVPALAQTAPVDTSHRMSGLPDMGLSYPSGGGSTASAPPPPLMEVPATNTQPGQEIPLTGQRAQATGTAESSPFNQAASPATSMAVPPPNTPVKDTTPAKDAAAKTATITPPVPAPAAAPPPDIYDSAGQPYSSRYYKKHSHNMTLVMLRRPELGQGQFVLRLAGQNMISGCPRISNIAHKVEFKESAVEITLEDYIVDMRNLTTAPQYDCRTRPHSPHADVVLDRDDLLAKNIHQLKIKIGDFGDNYDVDINQQRIRLTPSLTSQRTQPMFHTANKAGIAAPLTHWFYPQGTVLLYVPGAGDRDVGDALTAMAKEKGLEPIQDVYPDFKSPLTSTQLFYYIDKSGALTKKHDIGAGIVAGTVPMPKTVYGIEKDEQVTENLQVFARLPDAYQ